MKAVLSFLDFELAIDLDRVAPAVLLTALSGAEEIPAAEEEDEADKFDMDDDVLVSKLLFIMGLFACSVLANKWSVVGICGWLLNALRFPS